MGYLEEEAIISYTQMLNEIDSGKIPNRPAPQIAINYWNLPKNATIRDVTLAIRADEAMHRDANHDFSDRLLSGQQNIREEAEGVPNTKEISATIPATAMPKNTSNTPNDIV